MAFHRRESFLYRLPSGESVDGLHQDEPQWVLIGRWRWLTIYEDSDFEDFDGHSLIHHCRVFIKINHRFLLTIIMIFDLNGWWFGFEVSVVSREPFFPSRRKTSFLSEVSWWPPVVVAFTLECQNKTTLNDWRLTLTFYALSMYQHVSAYPQFFSGSFET